MRYIKTMFLAIMAITLLLPLLAFNLEKDSISPIDNRKLSEFELDAQDKTEMFNSYIKDRIGFRSKSIDLYTELNDKLFGEMFIRLILMEKMDTYFLNWVPQRPM